MPRTKSVRRCPRSQQGSVRRSARAATQASTRSAASGPSPRATPSEIPRGQSTRTQQDSLADEILPGLLDLIRDQVRAEIQAQQAAVSQGGQGSVTAGGSTSQQATIGQPAVTTTHSGQPITGIACTFVLQTSIRNFRMHTNGGTGAQLGSLELVESFVSDTLNHSQAPSFYHCQRRNTCGATLDVHTCPYRWRMRTHRGNHKHSA